MKKAASLWIAWVILLAIVVVSAAVVGKWWTTSSKNYISSMNTKFNTQQCNYLYFRIDSACQTLNSVKLTVDNPSSMDIDGLKVSMFDIYGDITNKEVNNQVLRSTYADTIVFLKDNVVTTLEITPFFEQNDNNGVTKVYCENKKIVINKLPFCDANQ